MTKLWPTVSGFDSTSVAKSYIYMYTAKQFLISFSPQVKDYWQLLQCRPKKSWVTSRQIHVQMQAKPANHSAFWALLPISCICSCLANHENHPISGPSLIYLFKPWIKIRGMSWRLVGAFYGLLKSIDHPPCYFPWWVGYRPLRPDGEAFGVPPPQPLHVEAAQRDPLENVVRRLRLQSAW